MATQKQIYKHPREAWQVEIVERDIVKCAEMAVFILRLETYPGATVGEKFCNMPETISDQERVRRDLLRLGNPGLPPDPELDEAWERLLMPSAFGNLIFWADATYGADRERMFFGMSDFQIIRDAISAHETGLRRSLVMG